MMQKIAQMTKRKKIVLLFVLIIVFTVLMLYVLIERVPNTDAPQRLSNIPKTAIWKGGIDEGFWFELEKIDTINKLYRFKIYNDYKGDLVLDAEFIKNSECKNDYPLDKNIVDSIMYFEFDKIAMSGNCFFEMKKPAYGGIFWEIKE